MGIGGTGVGGTSQPPQIRESETTAFTETMKKNVLAMLPADSLEVIPFTQRSYEEFFKYKSESGRPSLHSLLSLRTGSFPESIKDEVWQPIYQSLLNSLPPEIKEQLEQEMLKPFGERDPVFVELNSLLILVSKWIGWVEAGIQPIVPDSADERAYLLNLALPYIALRGVVNQTESVLEDAQSYLDALGPNYSQYDTVTSYISQIKNDLSELNALRELLEKGQDTPEIRQKILDISIDLARLSDQFQRTGSTEFLILGNTLEALALVSAAWALDYGSPSLLLSLTLATIGISSANSDLGLVGETYDTILDWLLDGLLSSILTGPGVQLEEMDELYNALVQLRDQS